MRNLLARLTGARFEVTEPHPDHPAARVGAEWFVWSRDLADIKKTAHMNVVWKDKEERVWLESIVLGDTTDLVESFYGEKGAHEAMSIDLTGFTQSDIHAELASKFPLVEKRLRSYGKLVMRVSNETEIRLEILYDGDEGIATFRLGTRIEMRDKNQSALLRNVKRSARALKVAYDQIVEIDSS